MFLTDNTWRLYFPKQISFCFRGAFPYHNFSKVAHFPKVKFGYFIFLPDQRFFILELALKLCGFDIDKMNEEGNKIYNSYSSGNVLLVICGYR